MNAILFETRREVFEEVEQAKQKISLASATLGQGNEHIREAMIQAQRELQKVVSLLWELPLK